MFSISKLEVLVMMKSQGFTTSVNCKSRMILITSCKEIADLGKGIHVLAMQG